jgi:DNA (cytosine-5)-methyltransferase 1
MALRKRLWFYEFFAGGGMARAGLGDHWGCAFANDIDARKGAVYHANWGGDALLVADIATLETVSLPGRADLAWASFPCQDLSQAGVGAGLDGRRSGTFWPFWRLMEGLVGEGRAPTMIVLENVCGALTSHQGADFAAICRALAGAGYRFGAMVADAVLFTPQSRPRLFVIAVRPEVGLPKGVTQDAPSAPWHTAALRAAISRFGDERFVEGQWIWWRLPLPPGRTARFADLIEETPVGVRWRSSAETERLLAMMSDCNRAKVEAAQAAGRRMVGAVYRRTRLDDAGQKVQRAEIRFDDVAGCLRTPAGGSSRQTLLVVDGPEVRSRLISPRETARLMGLPDSYRLPGNANEAYHLTGDGVAVPVVSWLARHILEPVLAQAERPISAAA